MGGLETEEFICQLLCIRLKIIIVSVAYRLDPEVAYPSICYDVYDAMKWVGLYTYLSHWLTHTGLGQRTHLWW